MRTVEKHDVVHELSDAPCPASGAPNPLLLADESTLVIRYIAALPSPEQADGSVAQGPIASPAIVVFRQCFASHFGTPNDDAFISHPLGQPGLRPYGTFLVENSSWVRGLEFRNSSHPRHDPELFHRLKHWVWTFHDSVLECAALSYSAIEVLGDAEESLSQMHALLRSQPTAP